MTIKLKIVLGILVILAGFLLTRIGLTIKKSAETANRVRGESTTLPEENSFLKDSDNDGIADYDEAYYRTDPFNPDSDGDSYLDGEEVAAGFNPTEDDKNKRPAEEKNITITMTDRLLAGIYAGDLNPRGGKGQKFDDGINMVALAAIDEAAQATAPSVNNSLIRITDDSKESQEQYLRDVANLLEGPFLSAFMSQPQVLSNVANNMLTSKFDEAFMALDRLALDFTTAYTRLAAVGVPPLWLGFHKNLLAVFRKISINYRSITKINEDPVLALTGLVDFTNNLASVDSLLLQELRFLIKKGGLEIPSSPLFETVGLLN